MIKYVFTAIYLFSAITFASERTEFINLSAALHPKLEKMNDISYIQVTPQYEENPDPKKAVTIEYFFGEYNETPRSQRRVEYIKQILAEDKRLNPNFKLEFLALSSDTHALRHSKALEDFKFGLNLESKEVIFEEIPIFLTHTANLIKRNKSRMPSSMLNAKKIWTLVRFTTVSGGTFAGLYFMEGLSAPLAASLAFWPGLVSGGIVYHMNVVGQWLTNGRWSSWLIQSDNYFARKIKKVLKINLHSLRDSISRNRGFFKQKYPRIFEKNSKLFEKGLTRYSAEKMAPPGSKIAKTMKKMAHFEEYFKWWVTEVAFTSLVFKTPQVIAGVATLGTAASMAGDVLLASSMGMLAQGPADIAIQIRKYQMIKELKANIQKGLVQVDNEKALLHEIEKVLAKTGAHKNYIIRDNSHKALVQIENWSRSRSTFLSFFSVVGVGLEVAGVPFARPMLIGIGTFGAAYYAHVQGLIKPKKIAAKIKDYINKVAGAKAPLANKTIDVRQCQTPFLRTVH